MFTTMNRYHSCLERKSGSKKGISRLQGRQGTRQHLSATLESGNLQKPARKYFYCLICVDHKDGPFNKINLRHR